MKKRILFIVALALVFVCVLGSCGDETVVHTHSYDEWQTTVAATCTEAGLETRYCTCGEKQTSEITAIGHSFGEWSITAEATCTENGFKKRTCFCGAEEGIEIASTGHTYGEITIIKNATCTEIGSQKRTCLCGNELVEEIAAIGHNLSEATCTTPKKCQNNCEYTEGEALGHINNNGYCERCGDKITIDMNTVVGNPNECASTSFFGFCYYKNSVDGIKLCWGGENLSGKTINYYSVTLYFYNSVGDPAYSEITGKSSKTVKYVGPVAPGKDLIIFGIVDYVPVCSKVLIGEITLEYSDGTTDTGWYGWYTTYRNSNIK